MGPLQDKNSSFVDEFGKLMRKKGFDLWIIEVGLKNFGLRLNFCRPTSIFQRSQPFFPHQFYEFVNKGRIIPRGQP